MSSPEKEDERWRKLKCKFSKSIVWKAISVYSLGISIAELPQAVSVWIYCDFSKPLIGVITDVVK